MEPETMRRSTVPDRKPIPPGQPKWVYMLHDLLSARNYFAEKHAGIEKVTKYNLFKVHLEPHWRKYNHNWNHLATNTGKDNHLMPIISKHVYKVFYEEAKLFHRNWYGNNLT